MHPTHLAAAIGGNPGLHVTQAFTWLITEALHLVLGLAAGALLARSLRARGLHWSWALAALPAIPPASALGAPELTVALAAAVAARTGRRLHREDLMDGGDLARAAHARRSPGDALRVALGDTLGRSGAPAGASREAMTLGRDDRGRAVRIAVGGGRHTLVVGATGSGKTVTQASIAVHAIERGAAAIAIDPKGDRDLREALASAAASAGRRFLSWSPQGGAVYNPYERGGSSEIADRLLAAEPFSEPHYLRQAQRYIAHVVSALRAAGEDVCLRTIAEHLEPVRLELLARELGEGGRATHDYLDALTPRQRADLSGVRDRLALVAESDVGRWLDPRNDAAPRFELEAAVRAGATVCFTLEADRRPLLSEMLGAAIVQDLLATVASLQSQPVPALVMVDEFSAIAARHVVRLFARARSAGFSLLLGTQELADLRLRDGEQVLDQVLGNLSVLIAHRQVVPGSAELISAIAGSRGTWRVSRHSDGRHTRTRAQERVLVPEQVARLDTGRAAVLRLHGGGAEVVRVDPAGVEVSR
ncbi:MAG TPA: helicase HerA-like domain-containing protein [Solirubrobacteraceae bacterium]|nr:helicase HerA-like domain-containing protein [Solirubrobacteraceae bacterium]